MRRRGFLRLLLSAGVGLVVAPVEIWTPKAMFTVPERFPTSGERALTPDDMMRKLAESYRSGRIGAVSGFDWDLPPDFMLASKPMVPWPPAWRRYLRQSMFVRGGA